jgi:hypothetical protein
MSRTHGAYFSRGSCLSHHMFRRRRHAADVGVIVSVFVCYRHRTIQIQVAEILGRSWSRRSGRVGFMLNILLLLPALALSLVPHSFGEIQPPVVSFAWLLNRSRDLPEYFMKRQEMTDGIL